MSCLRCLKFTMCVANFFCFICGISVLGLGIYMSLTFKMAAITRLTSFNVAHVLMITGIIITCVSFLGFLGALKENRCLLLTFFLLLFILMLVELAAACLLLVYETEISQWLEADLKEGLRKAKQPNNATILTEWDLVQGTLHCCGVTNASDWESHVPDSCCERPCIIGKPKYYKNGCFLTMKELFEENFVITGITVILLCLVEVLGMCFAMTLFCRIKSEQGLQIKF